MRNEIKSGVIISYIQTFLSIIISLVITPITIRSLGQSEYGIYSLVGTIIPYLTVLDLGFSNAIVRFITECRVKNDKDKEYKLNGMFMVIYSFIGIICLIVGVLIIINISNIFKNGLNPQEILKIKYMLIIVVIYISISFPFKLFNGIITAYEKFLFLKTISLITTIINPLIILLIVLSGNKSIMMTLNTAIIGLSVSIVQMIYCIKVLKIKIKFEKFNMIIFKELFSYSFYIFVSSIVNIIYWSTDSSILGIVANSSEIAIYSVASTFNNYLNTLTMVISGMMIPKVVSMITQNKSNSEITDLFIKISRIQLQIVGLIMIGFLLVGRQFINIWAGTDYDKAYFIALLIMSVRIIPICQVLGTSILEVKNMHKIRSIVYLLVAILNLVISIPLGKMYGGIGCAIGTVIGLSLNIIIINIYYSKVGLEMKRYWIELLKLTIPIVLSLLIGVSISKIVNLASFKGIIIFSILFVPIYSIIIMIFGMNKYEKNLIILPVKKILNL